MKIVRQAIKKPIPVDFIEWTGKNLLDVIRFTGQNASAMDYKWDDYCDLVDRKGLKIFTLEGDVNANIGDMIMKGVRGECWPINGDIFRETYNIIE